MQGYLGFVLHAHLPFVRHPEHAKFLEESWLFEAITETYVPLIHLLEGWQRDGIEACLTLTLSPTLCAMLRDPLLQQRYTRHLEERLQLAEREIHRTAWEAAYQPLAQMYLQRLRAVGNTYHHYHRDLVQAFRQFQEAGLIEIIPCAATHAVLPLLASHYPSVRAQVLIARDYYRECFQRDPVGFWLPECAYADAVEKAMLEASLRWFILETHGLMNARPRPRYRIYAPIHTPNGLTAFGRDPASARQVWSREGGYPGDARYRDFYRDIGYDLDYDYIRPYLPDAQHRGFTGFKYYRITGGENDKRIYDRLAALQAVAEHAAHFVAERLEQMRQLNGILERPPLIVMPYDAELFGHWWFEGPEFLDTVIRAIAASGTGVKLTTLSGYLRRHPAQQVAIPSASSWGEEGFWRVWLNESNAWIYPYLQTAQQRMTELVRRFPKARGLAQRALQLAGHELIHAQASDWPFILRTGTSPQYALQRLKDHFLRLKLLYDQLTTQRVDPVFLDKIEACDRIFPNLNCHYWA